MYAPTFRMFAAYNQWANEALYETVATLPRSEFVADRGLFFGSLMHTMNHLLVTDRIWQRRFTGSGEAPDRLDAILFEAFDPLRAARVAEDERLATWIEGLGEADFEGIVTYRTVTTRQEIRQPLAPGLFHLFNHQTHHRGQCHAALTGLGRKGPVFDMVAFQRQKGIGLS